MEGGRPIQLIRVDEGTRKLELCPDAVKLLKSLPRNTPVAPVAVCGRARTGKSLVLNQLLGASTGGFTVAPSYRPCTKGLWLWSSPIQRQDLAGRNYILLLLDTEGIDAYSQTTQDAVRLFSLTILLSSLFIFNQMGPIDESALDRLSLVAQITKHVRARAGSGKQQGESTEDVRSLAEFSPSFLWLLRDFYLSLEDDQGYKVSARDYLETALMAVPGEGPAVDAKNSIRASIKMLFPDRDCFTLVRPVAEEEKLRQLGRLPAEELRPEFVEGVAKLTALAFSKAQPKRVGIEYVNGPMLAGLADAYVKAINEGAVPTISTAWQSVAETECRQAAYAAEDRYREVFDEDVPAEELDMRLEHERALAAGRDVFRALAVGDKQLRARFKEQYLRACQGRFEMLREKKLAQAGSGVEAALYKAAASLHTVARLKGDMGAVAVEVQRLTSEYSAVTSGPTKWTRLVVFLQEQLPAIAQDLEMRQAQLYHAELERLEEEVARARAAQQAAEKRQQIQAISAPLKYSSAPKPGLFSRMFGCFGPGSDF